MCSAGGGGGRGEMDMERERASEVGKGVGALLQDSAWEFPNIVRAKAPMERRFFFFFLGWKGWKGGRGGRVLVFPHDQVEIEKRKKEKKI